MTTYTSNIEEKFFFERGDTKHKDGSVVVCKFTRPEFERLVDWSPESYRTLFAMDRAAYEMRQQVGR